MLEQVNAVMRHPMAPLLVIALGLLMGLAAAVILRRKGRSSIVGFALGCLLGPFGVAIALGFKRETETLALGDGHPRR